MIEVLRYGDREEWQQALRAVGADDVFFSPDYLKINELITDGEAECLVWRRGDSLVVYPYIRRPIEGSPWLDITSAYGFGGYMKFPRHADFVEFDEAFCAYCRQNGIVSEFIRFHPLYDNHSFVEHRRLRVTYHQPVVYADFSRDGFAFARTIKKEGWKKIRKAVKHGMEVVADAAGEFYPQFVSLYEHTMDFKQASSFYYFGDVFFESLKNRPSTHSVLFVALHREEMVGGLLVLFSGSAAYNFLSCSDYEHNGLGTNDLLQFKAMEWAHDRGLQGLLLGGGNRGEDSLFHFKAKFSPERRHYYTARRIHLPKHYGSLCRQALQRNGGPGARRQRAHFPFYRHCQPSSNTRCYED